MVRLVQAPEYGGGVAITYSTLSAAVALSGIVRGVSKASAKSHRSSTKAEVDLPPSLRKLSHLSRSEDAAAGDSIGNGTELLRRVIGTKCKVVVPFLPFLSCPRSSSGSRS